MKYVGRNRIDQRFHKLETESRKGLVPFIMAGDPDLATTAALLRALPQAGADFIELGIPFSDPMADGPVITAAGQRALAQGVTIEAILQMLTEFRKHDAFTPVILMGYYNPIYRFGIERFCEDGHDAGVDGAIIVDLPPEEDDEFTTFSIVNMVHYIHMIAPTTTRERVPIHLRSAGGFLYHIAVKGITGGAGADMSTYADKFDWMRERTGMPVVAGFGIKTPEEAGEAARYADAVVVGSALVECLHQKGVEAALSLVRSLREGIDKATRAAAA